MIVETMDPLLAKILVLISVFDAIKEAFENFELIIDGIFAMVTHPRNNSTQVCYTSVILLQLISSMTYQTW